jgi:N-acylneuraminate cytidylyltransferase
MDLVIIPARGGSKGIPDKNIKKLCGKPLILYTVEVARKLFADSQIIVSTDSQRIKEIVEKSGLKVPFLRPTSLSNDFTAMNDVILHALDYFERSNTTPKKIILLQPTSPLRNENHLKGAIELFNEEIDLLVSVKKTDSNPYYVQFEENEKGFLEKSKKGFYQRRQDCPDVWELNGAIYIYNTNSVKSLGIENLKKIKKFVMDSYSSIDIDSQIQFDLADLLISRLK